MNVQTDKRGNAARNLSPGLGARVAFIVACTVFVATMASVTCWYVLGQSGTGGQGAALPIIYLLVVAVLGGALAGALVSHLATRQLQRLRVLNQKIMDAAGATDAPSPLLDGDEIEMLVRSFERLVQLRLEPEAQMRARETTLRAVLEAGLDAFLIARLEPAGENDSATFRVAYANAAAARLFGRTAQELIGIGIGELPPSESVFDLREKSLQVHRSRTVVTEELDFADGGALPRWFHCQFLPLPDGVALILRDITQEKVEEAQARQSRTFLRSLIQYLPVLIFAKSFRPDNADKMVVWNRTAEHVMGYSADQVIGKSNHEIFPSKVADTLNALDRQMLAHPKVVTIPEFPYRRPDGALCYLRSISVPLFGENGNVDYILGIVEDITARREQEWQLRSQQAELAAINDSLPVGLFRTDAEGKLLYVNPTFEKMAGMDFEALARQGWYASIHPEDRERILKEWSEAIHSGLPYQNTLRFQSSHGDVSWASLKAAQVKIDGKVRGYVGSVDDITARLQAEQDVLKGERWLRTIADNLPALIAYVDKHQRYRFTNIHYEELFEREGAKVVGRHVSEVFGSEYYAFTSGRITAALRGERVSFEREGSDRAGRKRHWRVEYIPDMQGDEVAGFYSMVLDITESKELENRLRTLARIDSLTGLANRSYFTEKLTQALQEVDGKGLKLAVLFLDIDHFKAFNDEFGHHGGDIVLREFSRRLTACVRNSDTVARLAGDEFVILLLGGNIDHVAELIAKKIMAEMEREFTLPNGLRRVTTSIGIALKRDQEIDPDLLLQRADQALYAAKSAGRNGFETFL